MPNEHGERGNLVGPNRGEVRGGVVSRVNTHQVTAVQTGLFSLPGGHEDKYDLHVGGMSDYVVT